jgi:hypothetical protein
MAETQALISLATIPQVCHMTNLMTCFFRPGDSDRFREAVRRFDEANAKDPTQDTPGNPQPRELAYALRLSQWVLRLRPEADEALRLAARCQHLCRWMIPRASYPATRAGYLRWREDLKRFHAEKAGEILRDTGYPSDLIARVQALNLKQHFPQDPDARVLEDALCLVFLEFQLESVAAGMTEEKALGVLRKTWKKMTPQARAQALKLSLPGPLRRLVEKAAAGPEGQVS